MGSTARGWGFLTVTPPGKRAPLDGPQQPPGGTGWRLVAAVVALPVLAPAGSAAMAVDRFRPGGGSGEKTHEVPCAGVLRLGRAALPETGEFAGPCTERQSRQTLEYHAAFRMPGPMSATDRHTPVRRLRRRTRRAVHRARISVSMWISRPAPGTAGRPAPTR